MFILENISSKYTLILLASEYLQSTIATKAEITSKYDLDEPAAKRKAYRDVKPFVYQRARQMAWLRKSLNRAFLKRKGGAVAKK